MKTYLGSRALLVAWLMAPAVPASSQAIRVGDVAPDFTVVDHATGATLRMTDFAGKVLVLDFFAYWCGPCQTSSPLVERDIQQYYAARGGNPAGVPVQVLAINIDQSNRAATDSFIRNAGISLAADDIRNEAWRQHDTNAIPTFVILNGVASAQGLRPWQVLYRQAGYAGAPALRNVIDSVRPATNAAPTIATQPSGQTILAGQPIRLTVLAAGFPAPTYQWYKDGNPLAGATTDTLAIAAATVADSGTYTVTAQNTLGRATSRAAVITVVTAFVSPATREIGPGRVTSQITIQSLGQWTAASDTTWASLSRTSGHSDSNLDLIAEPNPGAADRTAVITVGGSVHTLTQRGAGTVVRELWALGDDSDGQLAGSRLLQRAAPAPIATGVRSATGGVYQSFFIKTDGTLWATGNNGSGQLGDGTTQSRSTPVLVASAVQSVASGPNHTLFLKSDGSLWAMGSNTSGQLGDGTTTSRVLPVQVAAGVRTLAVGYSHSLFVKTDGTLWAAGYNNYGQLGDGSTLSRSSPVMVAADVQGVTAGSSHTAFWKTDGTAWTMGYNFAGQLGDGTTTHRSLPVPAGSGVVAAEAGDYHTALLKTDGSVWVMGYNYQGQLGDGTTTSRHTPVQVASAVRAVSAGNSHTLLLKTDGTVWATGSNSSGQLADGSTTNRTTPGQVASGMQGVAAGNSHTLLLQSDGTLWGSGACARGQLGDGTPLQRSTPLQVATGVQAVAAAVSHSLLLRTDGTVWGVGYNGTGQLGDGTNTSRGSPVQVAAAVQAIAAGGNHSLLLKTDGSLWTTGYNYYGQLGDGSTTNRTAPVQIATGVKAAAAGTNHSLFLKTDGTAWAAGYNNYGQLGDGSNESRTSPVQFAADVRQIASGFHHTLFVRTNGTLWSTGYNFAGQLGTGTTTNRNSPVQVAADVADIAAGFAHSLFLKTDGSLWGMGYNYYGQLGDGTSSSRSTPVPIATGVQRVAAGLYSSYFLKTDGSLWAMGSNAYGQLGDGTTLNRRAPVHVADYVVALAAGSDFVLYVTESARAAAAPRIANLAVRTALESGQVLTVGFVTTGSKRLLARAVGPSLRTVAGIADFLPDPRICLIRQSTGATVAENDDWDAGLAPLCSSLGAFPLNAGSKDGALVYPVNGGHTAQIQGGGSGIVLVEVYDAESSSATRLTNVSARNHVGTGDNILIAGFVLNGTGTKSLLLRGIGPALRDLFGVSGALANPRLEIFRADGTRVAENDNWSPELAADFDRVGAFRFRDGSLDAALRVGLPAGAYTAQLSGVNQGTGDGLIEIYELP